MSDGDCELDCGDGDSGDCLCCCCCFCEDGSRGHTPHRCLLILLLLHLLVVILVAAFAFVLPVRVAVEDASLARLSVAGPNGTVLAYDISLAVAVHNRNLAMHARLGAPLDAELIFAGERFTSVRMRGSTHGNIRPGKKEVYNVAASGESAARLGSVGVAEFVKESAAGGAFRLQLRLAGEVKYPPHGNAHRLEATCSLELPLSSTVRFKKIKMRRSTQENIRPGKTEMYNIAALGESDAPLGSVGVAEFVKESAERDVFQLKPKLTGYPPHGNAWRLEATCPLELPL